MSSAPSLLGILAPTPRLIFVIVASSSFVFISDPRVAIWAFVLSIITLVTTRHFPYGPFAFVIAMTVAMYFLSNYAFSPPQTDDARWWIFHFNNTGLTLGVTGSMKRGAMVALSLAWLACTRIPGIYDALAFVKPTRRQLMLFLRLFQIVKRDLDAARQALLIRDRAHGHFDVRGRIGRLRFMLQAVLLRMFALVGKVAYAAEAHRPAGETLGLIELHGISASYYQTADVVKGLDLRIDGGEFVFVAGRNGSGKTTLLRILSGYVPKVTGQLSGQVTIGGANLDTLSLAQSARTVRYVPTDSVVSVVGLTVGQEMTLGTRDAAAATRAMQLMEGGLLWDKETTKLSGGQQMKVLLASVLASNTRIVALDSPLEQIDLRGRRAVVAELARHVKNGNTVVISDINYELVRPHLTRFILMEEGALAADLQPNEVTDRVMCRAGLVDFEKPAFVQAAVSAPQCATMTNVRVAMEGQTIVNDFSLVVQRGECIVIVGPNGSGKTTVMLTLAGAIRPVGGEIRLTGRVGYVFQDTALQMVEPRSADEIGLGPRLRLWQAERRTDYVRHYLRWAGLNGSESSSDASAGQSKRIGIASMIMDCSILAIDEPSVGLDAFGIRSVAAEIQGLRARGVAVVVVTHDPRIMRLASRVIVMKGGQVAAECDVETAMTIMQEWLEDDNDVLQPQLSGSARTL